ncbi:MAG: hypothetical protein RL701_1950 [Pseudomonadota bacterium]|jgi:hypothetical protein
MQNDADATPHSALDAVEADVQKLEPMIGRERLAIGEDLARARELLRDGMSRLQQGFDALRSSVDAQASSLSTLRDEASDGEARTAAIAELARDHQHLLKHSESVMMGLQLEDILGQLLDFTRQRAEGLSQIAATLAEAVDRESLVRRESLHERLKTAVAAVDKRADALCVQQESLATGDIELF